MGITGLNAFTDSDATVYVSEIPNNRVEAWARVEAGRYSDAVFRLFWPELEAVYEEKNRGLDNPRTRANEAFMKAMFPHHGYGWSTTIGETEHLKNPAYGDMVAFFQRYYTPANMAILLSGDVDESVLPILEREFGSFQRPAGDAPDPGQQPALHGRTVVDVPVPTREGIVIGWSLVPASHADRVPLDVMDLLLYDGRAGLLKTDLLLPQKVANATAAPEYLREAGVYRLSADALAGQKPEELEKLLLGLVDKLQRGEFSDSDIASAVLNAEIGEQRQLESNGGRERMMEEAFIDGVEWQDAVARIERMKKVTKADVVRVAKQYLTGDMLVVRKLKGEVSAPKITKPPITPIQVDPSRQTAFAKSILDMPATPIEPVSLVEGKDYVRGKLATGPVLAMHNTRNGLFSVSFGYDYGRADDRMACFALSVLKVSGAGSDSASQVVTKLHDLGITIDTACGKDSSNIFVAGLDRNLEAGMQLLRDWLASPVFDDATLKATVATALTQRDNEIKDPQQISRAQAELAELGEQSSYRLQATNKQLQAATPAQIKKLLAGYLHLDFSRGKVVLRTARARRRVGGDHARRRQGQDPPDAGDGVPRRQQRDRDRRRQRRADADLGVLAAQAGGDRTRDRAAGELFGEYVEPVLYQEVREARGLAYTVFGGYSTNRQKADPSVVFAYVGTQGDKTDDAVAALLATLHAPVDDSRLATAKESIAQNHRVERIAPRAIPNWVYGWDLQGETSDPRDAREKREVAVDKAALDKWAKGAMGGPVIVAVYGNRKKLDEAKLGKLAKVTWVPVDQLFGY